MRSFFLNSVHFLVASLHSKWAMLSPILDLNSHVPTLWPMTTSQGGQKGVFFPPLQLLDVFIVWLKRNFGINTASVHKSNLCCNRFSSGKWLEFSLPADTDFISFLYPQLLCCVWTPSSCSSAMNLNPATPCSISFHPRKHGDLLCLFVSPTAHGLIRWRHSSWQFCSRRTQRVQMMSSPSPWRHPQTGNMAFPWKEPLLFTWLQNTAWVKKKKKRTEQAAGCFSAKLKPSKLCSMMWHIHTHTLSSSIRARDSKKLSKLIKKDGSVLSMTRGALELIVQRGVLHKLQNITDNTSSAPYAVETIEYLHVHCSKSCRSHLLLCF